MPAEEGVRLDDEKGLFPEGRCSGQEQESDAVLIAEPGAFDLALQDDQLLPEKGVLGDELGFAAHGILNRAYEESASAGFEHLLDAIADLVGNAEDFGSEALDDVEHAWLAPGI